jgi:hypothetical protein
MNGKRDLKVNKNNLFVENQNIHSNNITTNINFPLNNNIPQINNNNLNVINIK